MEEEIGYWKQNLYLLQEAAPRPFPVKCLASPESSPPQYGTEFHGLIEREVADNMLLEAGEGAFLVRASRRSPGANTLCMFFDGRVLNYKLFYDGMHYVGEKRFEHLEDLVADGLITMHMEKHANDYIQRMADEAIYEQSPYSQYQKATDCRRQPCARCHNFTPATFRIPHYCDYCRNFMWGLVQQGVKCEDCGFCAHKKCSERTIHDCRPEAKYVKRMFAVDISTLCMAHAVSIPPVVSACITEVERRGLFVEGIYRVSGSHEQMERLRRQFDTLHKVDLSIVEDIHTVAGLLKLYLRLLPQQLVPFSVYRSLLTAYTNNRAFHERSKMCRKVLKELNEANGRTLLAILMHMQRVADNSGENKMSVENLATIFSPTLFCTGTVPALPQQQHQLLHFLIQNPRIVPFS
ncbi:RhoGAP domain containing protein [Brugia malayi]|uniref:RhoGAP domain containing protein n=1 Tax=Brugia malayi TaxID=6279 RepID=A0A4E9F7C0_BRUMA|nr:RhoGAP domain containing protein [Brugia malayi]VIO91916.1 RhoGAP domain containing protein [Brugia malayi]